MDLSAELATWSIFTALLQYGDPFVGPMVMQQMPKMETNA
jgi:hypothetical protein